MNEKVKLILKALISLVILVIVVNFVGIEKLNIITEIQAEYFVFVAGFFVFSVFLVTLAIKDLLKKNEITEIFKFKAISWSTGLFLPGKIGEISFVLLLKKTGVSTKKALAIFFLDRFVSFSIIGILAVIGFFTYFEVNFDIKYFVTFVIVLISLFLIKNKIKKIKLVKKTSKLLNETKEYLKKEKNPIAINYFFSGINFIIMFWATQLVFLSLGQKITLIDIALISSLALIIGLIPITINGLGVREGALVYLYSLVGIEPQYSILVALIFLVASYLVATIFLALFYNEFSFILKRKGKENAQN